MRCRGCGAWNLEARRDECRHGRLESLRYLPLHSGEKCGLRKVQAGQVLFPLEYQPLC